MLAHDDVDMIQPIKYTLCGERDNQAASSVAFRHLQLKRAHHIDPHYFRRQPQFQESLYKRFRKIMTQRTISSSDEVSDLILLNRRLRRTKRRLLLQYLKNNQRPKSSISPAELENTVAEQNRTVSPYSS